MHAGHAVVGKNETNLKICGVLNIIYYHDKLFNIGFF